MRNSLQDWEKRARSFGSSITSVMDRSFPSVVNEYIGRVHMYEISSSMQAGAHKVLDAGCGWGRLAYILSKKKNSIFIWGIDGSPTFVKMYNQRLGRKGKAIASDMRHLPFPDETFDFIYCVVSLMYLTEREDQRQALQEMLRVLKSSGRLVLIEPNTFGVQIVNLGGFVQFIYRRFVHKKAIKTTGISFALSDIPSLVHGSAHILSVRGYPLMTFLLLPCVVIGNITPSIAAIMLSFSGWVDRRFPFSWFSYFVTWVIEKQ